MDMRTAARAFKKAANKDFVSSKDSGADRAYPVSAALEAVGASPDVHEAVFAAVHGGEGQGTYQLPVIEFGGTYRANLGVTGCAFAFGFGAAALAEPKPFAASHGGKAQTQKQGIAKPEQDDTDYYKNKNFKNLSHG